MSKKTENIYTAIAKLAELQNQLKEYNKTADVRELSDIEFEMDQNLKNLKFWIDSLYSFNGKSKSLAKKAACKKNGKKGGRPPKQVTEARKKIAALEDEIPELERKMEMSDSVEERSQLEDEIQNKKNELSDLQNGLDIFMSSRQ